MNFHILVHAADDVEKTQSTTSNQAENGLDKVADDDTSHVCPQCNEVRYVSAFLFLVFLAAIMTRIFVKSNCFLILTGICRKEGINFARSQTRFENTTMER